MLLHGRGMEMRVSLVDRGWASPGVEDDVRETGLETDTELSTGEFSDVTVTEFQTNRLLWSVTAESELPVQVFAEFYADGVPVRTTSKGELGTVHDLSLVGLRSEADYEVTLYGVLESGEVALSSSTAFRTRALPEGLAALSTSQTQPDKVHLLHCSVPPSPEYMGTLSTLRVWFGI